MKYLLLAVAFAFPTASIAENNSNFSVGIGNDHGGVLGGKYAVNRGENKYYGSLGMLSYSSESGTKIGYGIGWERLIISDKHSAGLFIGTVSTKIKNDKTAIYNGISANYNYYFSGFSTRSFVLGGSVYGGKTSEDESEYDKNSNGLFVKLAYQW